MSYITDMVECPYCNHENDVTDALADGLDCDKPLDWECENCEKEFELTVEFDPCYSANEINYVNCDNCGKLTRKLTQKKTRCPFPKSLGDKKVCEDCWSIEVRKELFNNIEVTA